MTFGKKESYRINKTFHGPLLIPTNNMILYAFVTQSFFFSFHEVLVLDLVLICVRPKPNVS